MSKQTLSVNSKVLYNRSLPNRKQKVLAPQFSWISLLLSPVMNFLLNMVNIQDCEAEPKVKNVSSLPCSSSKFVSRSEEVLLNMNMSFTETFC